MSSDPSSMQLGTWITSVVDWGVVCLLAAYRGPNSPLAGQWAATCLPRGTTVNASQLPLPRL